MNTEKQRMIRKIMIYPKELYDVLQHEKEQTGVPITEIVRRAIDEYISRKYQYEEKIREFDRALQVLYEQREQRLQSQEEK